MDLQDQTGATYSVSSPPESIHDVPETAPENSTMTIFGKILDGEIPCHRVFENEHVLAFLDIGPLSRGHTLVIPKERRAHMHELSDEAARALGEVLPRLCRAVMTVTGCTAYNILQNNGAEANQEVPHVHFHIIPRQAGQGLGLRWQAGTLDHEAAADLAAALSAAVSD